jgi:hypothetical protein
MGQSLVGQWRAIWVGWRTLTLYQRFEIAVAFVLTIIISMVILIALYRLLMGVLTSLVFGALDPLDHGVFQRLVAIPVEQLSEEKDRLILPGATKEALAKLPEFKYAG